MADRASVFENAQIGLEAEKGTTVPATRVLGSMSIEPGTETEVKVWKPRGKKFATVAALNKEWTAAAVSGQATYTESPYAFASIFGKTTPSTPAGATLARQWLFDVNTSEADDPATYTVETGSDAGAQRFSYGLFVEYGMAYNRSGDGVSLSGAMLGRATQYGITPTSGATELDLVPIMPGEIDILVADSHPGLDMAEPLTRALVVDWKLGSRFGPIWALNRSFGSSFGGHIETDPSGAFSLKLGADSNGLAYLEHLRRGDTLFVRYDALGPEIEPGHNYACVIDLAVKIEKISKLEDHEGLVSVTYTGQLAHDATWGRAIQARLISNLASL